MRAFGGAVGYPMYPTRTSAPGVFGVNDCQQMIAGDRWPTVRDPLIANVVGLYHGNSVLNQGIPILGAGTTSAVPAWNGVGISTRSTSGIIFPGQSFISGGNDGLISHNNVGGSGDFCIEFFCRLGTVGTAQNILDGRPPGSNGFYPTIFINSSPATIAYFTNSSTRITSASALTIGVTYWVVYQRASGTGVLAVNGVSVGSWADANNYASNSLLIYGGTRFNGSSGATSGFTFDECRFTASQRYTFPTAVPTSRFPDY